MKTALMVIAAFALLPFALPAIVVAVVIVAGLTYYLAPALWLAAVIFVTVKGIRIWKSWSASSDSSSLSTSSWSR